MATTARLLGDGTLSAERAPASARSALRNRTLWLLAGYAVITATALAALLGQLRADAIASGEQLMSSFAQLTAEQTAGTIQNVDQTLQIAENSVFTAEASGTASPESVSMMFHDLLVTRPYLRALAVANEHGITVYSSNAAIVGLDISDRQHFLHHKDHPGAGFQIGAPVRNRLTERWFIPATQARHHANGQFAGVIIGVVDPAYFNRIWTIDGQSQGTDITLVRRDGMRLMRSPPVESAMGAYIPPTSSAHFAAGARAGTFRSISIANGDPLVLAFRQLDAYPDVVVIIGQATRHILATWQRMVEMAVVGWIIATAALSFLAAWLVREGKGRQVAEAHSRMLFEAPYPMAVVDRETLRISAVNQAAIDQYGWSRDEWLTKTSNDFYANEDLPAVIASRQIFTPGDTRIVQGFRHRKKDGTLIDVDQSVRMVDYNGRPSTLVMAQDITARVRAERERGALDEQLRQSQKMESVGQLTGGVAHDFNNILMVILANTDALQEDETLEPHVGQRLAQIGAATERAADLTRSLLAFSRKLPLRPQRTEINDLVASTGKLLRRTLGEQVEIDSVLADDLWAVDVDRTQLENAILNLCINARDAMPSGGRLLLETRNAVLDEEYGARNRDVVPGAYAMLAVTDSGAGIPPENLARVFEPFFTTKEVGKGTGLGLSMVYGFVKQSNGHIEIHSEIGHGTEVRLYLPRSEAALVGKAAEQAPPMPRGDEAILVVEDDAQVRAAVVLQLQSLGYAVSQAADGADALAALDTLIQPYDLLLTDVVMPGLLNGKALADQATLRWPGAKVLFMSGYSEDVVIHHGRLDPGVQLLTKPFRKIDLAQAIRRVLDGAMPASG